MPHADEGRLHAYLDGALHAEDPRAARALESHLETCADCQALLEFERAVRDEASALLADALPAAAGAPPPWEEILHRAGRGESVAAAGSGAAASVAASAAASGAAAGDAAATPHGGGHAGVPQSGQDRRPHRGFAWLPAGPRLAWAASVVVALGVGWWSHAALGADPFRPSAPTGEESTILDMVPGGAPEETAADDAAAGEEGDARGEARESFDDLGPATPAASQNEAAPPAARRDPADPAFQAFAETESPDGPPAASEQEPAAQREPAAAESAPRARGARQEAAAAVAGDVAIEAVVVDSVEEEDALARDAPPAPPALAKDEDAPEPAAVAPQLLEGIAAGFRGAESWTRVDLTEARALLGRTPVGVPGADLVDVSWGAGGRTLRVTQRLETGERVDLYQWNVAEAGNRALDGAALADSAARSERAAAARRAPGTPTILTEEGLLVAGSGSLDAAALQDLLATLEPLEE
ncbi:MAG TPA: hypothetical protein VK837_08410 [Longimicrobiales bacterium]|nr:hypothetical protein [Longimicrobiales bacterium]